MRIVLQRVTRGEVKIDNVITGSISKGIVLLVGVGHDDSPETAAWMAAKCAELRIFEDESGKMNRSVKEIGGGVLIVSQFTLYGDCSRGKRPSFTKAAPPDKGKGIYDIFVKEMRRHITDVSTGIFGAMMQIELVNDGPVTIIIDH